MFDGGGKFRLGHSLTPGALRTDARYETGIGLREQIIRRAAEEYKGFTDWVEVLVGAESGELAWPVAARIRSPCLVVVPIKSLAQALARPIGGSPWPGRRKAGRYSSLEVTASYPQ
jgi:hypothetical protein